MSRNNEPGKEPGKELGLGVVEAVCSVRPRLRQISGLVLLFCCTGLLLFQYQNCAPLAVSASGSANFASLEETGLPVTIIDDMKKDLAVSFEQQKVEVHSQLDEILVVGRCSPTQEDARLAWTLSNSENEVARGFATCKGGEFAVDLAPIQELECNHEYRVTAQLGAGAAGQITVSRRCTPDAVVDATPLKTHLAVGTTASCVLERHEGLGSGCSAVCYQPNGVVAVLQEMDITYCN